MLERTPINNAINMYTCPWKKLYLAKRNLSKNFPRSIYRRIDLKFISFYTCIQDQMQNHKPTCIQQQSLLVKDQRRAQRWMWCAWQQKNNPIIAQFPRLMRHLLLPILKKLLLDA